MERAIASYSQGDLETAFEFAQEALLAEPNQIDGLRIAASYFASKERFREAAETAVTLSTLQVRDPNNELLQAFQWHLRAGDLHMAERDLRLAIERVPNDARIHRTLAQLLDSQGRRYEARSHVLVLARQNVVSPRELLSLIDLSGPFELVSFAGIAGQSGVSLFELGKARYTYIADGKPDEALEIVNEVAAGIGKTPAVEAFRGRLLAETAKSESLETWMHELPPGTDQHPEYWLAIGLWLARHDRDKEAVHALGEALRLDPTDRHALRAMSASLGRLGEAEKAQRTQATLATLDKIFRIATKADAEQSTWIAEQLQTLTRPWESVGWYRHAFQLRRQLASRAEELNQRAAQIREWEKKADVEQIRDARVAKMLGFDTRQFPTPELDSIITPEALVKSGPAQSDLKFHDVAAKAGIVTSFVSDYPLEKVDFYLYQANGGGLAALDYDLDGRCDLYIVQSGGDPNQIGSSVPNQLFRQLPGQVFADASDESLTNDRGYGQGACASDVNQDGFPDLLVANIGQNSVYINQGDGTFLEGSHLILENSDRWTSSLAVGDLDGDQLPEIIEVNYLDDPLIFERKCEGKQLNCTPQRFRAASDRIFRSVGDGTFQSWDGANGMDELPNFGFGVVIANFDGEFGNDVFISNDGDENHFWKSISAGEAGTSRYRLTEHARLAGCNVGTSGISQACMGIASNDFDRNGLLDLLITNFHNEPVNLFLQNDSRIFVDGALRNGLVQPSKGVLGFGAQSADFDNDGWADLAILNGHIYDARYAGIPFRMVSQLLRGGPNGFTLQDADKAGPYWSRLQLARTLALLDWNQDGKMDLVANHLDQPIVILQNDSESANFLQLELVGVESERTAIGARVVVHAGDEHWTGWQIGGDGYMCTNESLIHFGIGRSTMIDKIEIDWPSGRSQTVPAINANRRYLIVEGEEPVIR